MAFQWLRFWNKSKSRNPLDHVAFLVYTRKGCHLCDMGCEILTRAQNEYGFLLQAQDVDSDPLLAEQFGQFVPVVLVNGKVRFRGRINDVLLKRLLEAEYAKSNGRE